MLTPPASQPSYYGQDIASIFKKGIVSEKDYKSSFGLARDAVETLKTKGKDNYLEMLEAVFWRDDISNFNAIGTFYRRFRNVLVIGMGGASLSGRALCSLFQSWVMSDSSFPFMYFLDNLDAEIFWELMSNLNPKTTGVLVISKSGETPETLLLLMRCLEYWKDLLTPQEISTNFTAVTTEKSALARIAKAHQLTLLNHPPHIGGRFSCFSIVGLLPLIMVGGDPRKVRHGGALVLKHFFEERDSDPLRGAALSHALYEKSITSHVIMPYGDAFVPLSQWLRQLVAESLGKQQQGLTPITALGPCDQHSQLQLYLDGPRDKFFTFFSEKNKPREKIKPDLWQAFSELDFLANATIEDLMHAEQAATAHVMSENGCPLRHIYVKTLNELSMGALFAHFTLEVLLFAELIGVNPLTQPAVDSVKVLAKRFLTDTEAYKRHVS
ncbi:hypothetical protein [Candidatus Hepatobacter penaei]|uniref:hypothetical protein n=1 Tax=Candidatus Hepatobacter penaei TaxID=1274402 RepID=UPI0006967393|nr:hypothetical protein [Candidatus Hepatobacter penaei]